MDGQRQRSLSWFDHLFYNELKSVVKKLNEMTTPDLLQELKTTKSSYKKEKIPVILLERYDSMKDEERKQVFKILLRKGVVDNNLINLNSATL